MGKNLSLYLHFQAFLKISNAIYTFSMKQQSIESTGKNRLNMLFEEPEAYNHHYVIHNTWLDFLMIKLCPSAYLILTY